jgi:chromate transporter
MTETGARPRIEVFTTFLRLGLTTFGGPLAHLAAFRHELVGRRQWLSEEHYAELVAYGQFLPGPTSSQVGFLLGYQRAGLAGAALAWSAFTLPSALALTAAALWFGTAGTPGPWLLGLQAAVLAVVAQAVVGMARGLCPDLARAVIAVGCAAWCLLVPVSWLQPLCLVLAALAGAIVTRQTSPAASGVIATPSRWTSIVALGLAVLVISGGFSVLAMGHAAPQWLQVAAIHMQAGSLVFGGGHVVLPLLREPLVDGGLIAAPTFLAGYGAAQLVPGPLFTVAAWNGAVIGGTALAAVALVAIFAPGLLLALGGLRAYRWCLRSPHARQAVAGLNAGVVGLLAAALISPLGRETLTSPVAWALTALAALALFSGRIPAWGVVLGSAGLSALIARI